MTPIADPALPGLAVATDITAVGILLRRAFEAQRSGADLVNGTVVDVRYEPGKRCTILYRFKLRRPGGRGTTRSQFVGRVLNADDTPAPLELERGHFFPEARLLIVPAGVDRAMPTLEAALDPRAVRGVLQRFWDSQDLTVRKVHPRLLGYTPDARAALIYEVLAEHSQTGVPVLRRLIGKIHAKKSAARLFAGSWAIWRDAELRFGLAPPVGHLAALDMTLQEQIQGVRLGGLAGSRSFARLVRQTARAIARFHALRVPLTTWRRPEDESQVVGRWAGVLAAIKPDEAPRIERHADRLRAALEAHTRVTGPVHGDFHHTNVLVGPDHHVSLIDLDESAYGDPLVDVGRFLASLRIPSLREFGDLRRLHHVQDAFLAEYLEHAPADERRIRLFESASLLTAAASAFRLQRQSWREEVTALVDESERLARGAVDGATARPAETKTRLRPPLDRLRWLLDGTYLKAALDPQLRAAFGEVELGECKPLLRSETSKDYRFDYELRGWRAGKRWSISLIGLAPREDDSSGRTTSRRLTELREALEGHPDALELPRPVAYLSPLALLVLQIPEGVPFSTLMGTAGGPAAAATVARALAALHAAALPTATLRSIEDEVSALARDVDGLRRVRPDLHARASRLAGGVGDRLRRMPVRVAPTLRSAHPRHLLCQDNRVGLSEPAAVVGSHPLTDVGYLLARTRLISLQKDDEERASQTIRRLRQVSLELERTDPGELIALEACALVHLACVEGRREPENVLAQPLLERAEQTLDS